MEETPKVFGAGAQTFLMQIVKTTEVILLHNYILSEGRAS